MESNLNMVNERKAGFSELVLTNVQGKTDKKPQAIVFRKNAKDIGLCLNFCPWCGEKIIKE